MRRRYASAIRRGILAGRMVAPRYGVTNDPFYAVRREIVTDVHPARVRAVVLNAYERTRNRIVYRRSQPMTLAECRSMSDASRARSGARAEARLLRGTAHA